MNKRWLNEACLKINTNKVLKAWLDPSKNIYGKLVEVKFPIMR